MWSIDRIEGEYALCEETQSGERCTLPLSELPPSVKEGTLLQKTESGWQTAPYETAVRRRTLAERLRRLLR